LIADPNTILYLSGDPYPILNLKAFPDSDLVLNLMEYLESAPIPHFIVYPDSDPSLHSITDQNLTLTIHMMRAHGYGSMMRTYTLRMVYKPISF